MKRIHRIAATASVLALFLTASSQAQTGPVDPVFQIPLLSGISVDGSADDWGDMGFRVEIMADVEGRFRAPRDFDPSLRLGWSEDGLLVLAQVRDDSFVESDIDRRLFVADSIELFVGTARNVHDYFMLLISPGLDPNHSESRHVFFDERDGGPLAAGTLPDLHAQIGVLPSDGGYAIETLIPWGNLDLSPRPGLTLAFQAYAMDRDLSDPRDPADPQSSTFRVAWYPAFDTHENQTSSMMTLELSDAPSLPVQAVVRGRYRGIEVVAREEYAGASLRIERGGEPIAETIMAAESGRVVGSLRLPRPSPGAVLGQFEILLDGQNLESIERGGAGEMVATAIDGGRLDFYQYVFSGPEFPRVEFQRSRVVEDLIGATEITTRYYGPDFQEVTSAETPGRYGAVVSVKPTGIGGGSGVRPSSRMFTLFRTPENQPVARRRVPPWVMPSLDVVKLPGGLTLSPEVGTDVTLLDEADAVSRAAAWDHDGSAKAKGNNQKTDADFTDKTWWVRCKRAHYGLAEKPVFTPLPRLLTTGDYGRELREGTPEEAGVQPEVIALLEAICDRWAASNGGQGFTICAARHGVAFFHRAYGWDQDTTVTKKTPGFVASVTKPITGTVFMIYMDHGLIDLDAPIGTYLSLFRTIAVDTPLTIRQLLTHTSGLSGHFGDEQHDLEERVADQYPLLDNPVNHLYSGRGFALAVKALEAISASAFPAIYDQILIQPLGMSDTTMKNSHNGGQTTAWDLAKLGQLMLNGGIYGNHRFFSPETLEQAKPQSLVQTSDPEAPRGWGIGFWGGWREEERHMTGSAFGHGSANSSFFRVDPSTDLVVTAASLEDKRYMTRSMQREFIEAIEAAIVDAP